MGFSEEEYPIIEVVGGGRIFSGDMKFDEIYDEKLWKAIQDIESGKDINEVLKELSGYKEEQDARDNI